MKQAHQGTRIYNLFPTLLGPIARREERLSAIADMGFNFSAFFSSGVLMPIGYEPG